MPELVTEVERPSVPASGATVATSIAIQPGGQEDDVTRQLVVCVDTSGSMSGEKIEHVRDGIRWVFGYLDDDDYLGIVSFDDEPRVVLPAQRWGDLSRSTADDAVDSLTTGGGTDILGGLELAHETLTGLPEGAEVGRRILLLSDGRDEVPVEQFGELARRYRREDGISIPAAGIGKFYDEDVVRAIGTGSDGEWVHLSRPADIEDFFGREVEDLRTVVAPNPFLELDLVAGADVEEVMLRTPQVQDANHVREGDAVRVFVPDLVEFEQQEVVLQLTVPPGTAGSEETVAAVSLQTPETVAEAPIVVEYSDDPVDLETRIERVDLKHKDTMIRKAASAGEIDEAETIIEQATEIHSEEDVGRMTTVVEQAEEGDTEAEYMTTKIQDSWPEE